jgi:hypothetical protein
MAQAIPLASRAPDSSLRSPSILDVALNEYRKNTGNDLLSHPLAIELQLCDSVDGILAILRRQADTFEQSRDRNWGLMKWISPSVHILYSFSAALGDGVSLVRLGNEPVAAILMLSPGFPTCETNLYWDWYPACRPYSHRSFRGHFKTEIVQAAKDVSASNDVLSDIFVRIEDFFKRFKIYSRSFVNAELADVLVKVTVKVLNILSIATKEIEHSRASESFLRF